MELRLGFCVAASVLAVTTVVTPARAQPAANAWDCLNYTNNSPDQSRNYFISPGFWTKGGAIIATTFPGGQRVDVPPGGSIEKCDHIFIEGRPDDFHFDGDMWNGTVYMGQAFWTQNAPPAGGCKIPIPDVGPGRQVQIIVDYTVVPPHINVVVNGMRIFDGPLQEFQDNPPPPPLVFGIVGARNIESMEPGAPIPTVSEWGLIVMTLLLLTAGTIVIRRYKAQAAGGTTPAGA